MIPTTVHFYIYYRIAGAHATTALSSIETVMKTISQSFAIRGQLLRAQNDAALWMEIYEDVVDPDRFEAELDDALAHTQFATWLSPGSSRRTERFVAFPDGSGKHDAPGR